MLKIGFVFDDSLDSYDGVAQYVKILGSWLSRQGHDVRYLVGETKMKEWSGGKVYSLAKNQSVSFNGNRATVPLPARYKKIKQILSSEQFDVLHVQVPYSPFMAQKVIRAVGNEVAVIGTFHVMPGGILSSQGSRILRLINGRSLKRFDEIVSVSPVAAQFAKSAFGIRSEVVPNVIEVEKFNKAAKKIKFKKPNHIVFLGRLVKRKGCHELLVAFDLLRRSGKKAKLTIAGDGPERQKLKELAEKLDIEKDINFLGFVEETDKPDLLASADVACFPSLYGESFGIVLIEAMAAGAGVVVGGNNPGYASVLGDQPDLLVDSRNSFAFADRLNQLLGDKKLAKQLHNWQSTEVKKYDVNVVGKKLLNLYIHSIAKRKQKADN